MSIANYLVNLTDGLTSQGVLGSSKGGTGLTTVGSSGQAIVSDGTNWVSQTVASGAPKVSQISYTGDNTAANPTGGETVTLTGTGFAAGARVLINQTQVSVVTVVSATQITFTAPALATGSYVLYVVNTDGGTAVVVPGIQYSGVPAWTTAAGTLGTVYETAAISSTVAATSDSAVSYSVISGALPTGATLAANGTISGTSPVTASSTTYTFTVRATDAENQETDRTFNLTINPDVVTWSSPANAATLVATPGAAYSSALMAASAAGQTVSYSADALPTGLAISGSTITGTPTTAGTSSSTLTATSAVTNRSAQVTISWTITVAGDAYFPYTTLLLNSETTAVPFLADASTNNFSLTVAGDTKPNNFNPYTPGYYSNYFDGTGDSLTVPSNAALEFGTGDFTIEFWMYVNTFGASVPGNIVNSLTGGFSVYITNSMIQLARYGIGGDLSYSVGFSTNTWYHVAITRASNIAKIFLNGVQVASGTVTSNYGQSGVQIGNETTGYISNVRLVKGTALYTTNFTPPTGPLTAVANTSLLTCQSNRLIDTSTNAFVLTKTGDVQVSPFDPFVPNSSYATYGSTYFDGTGDTLSLPFSSAISLGTGDFTMEAWCYPTTTTNGIDSLWGSSNYSVMLYHGGTSWTLEVGNGGGNYFTINATAPIYAWNHIAVTRSGSNFNLWINGVSAGTGTTADTMKTSGTLTIGGNGNGQNFTGYISDYRLVKGTAVYTTAFTPPATPLTAITNTALLTCQTNQPLNNQTFLDNSTNSFPITRTGNATQGSFSPYGANWSNYFNGSTDYLDINYTALQSYAGNATIECWFKLNALPTGTSYNDSLYIIGSNPSASNPGIDFAVGSNAIWFSQADYTQRTLAGTWTPNLNWHHIAVTRNTNTWTMWLDGVSIATATSSNAFHPTGTIISIGRCEPTGGEATGYMNGYISNLRIVKGTALYTSAFTPSTQPLTDVSGTSLLICQSASFVDNSPNASVITPKGTISTQKFNPFATVTQTPVSHSVYFDGTGDYLSTANNVATNLGTGDFTVEFWLNASVTQAGSNPRILSNDTWNTSAGFDINIESSLLQFRSGGGTGKSCTFTTTDYGIWQHIAFTRSGTSFKVFKNGILANTYTDSSNLTSANPTYIGKYAAATGSDFTGYISNLRIVKGTALYTANFTPATTPLTAVTNTQLLTCQSPTLTDNSVNQFAVTAFGDAKPRQQNPFGSTTSSTQDYTPTTFGGSVYLDGSDYLTVPNTTVTAFGTGDFTIEFWTYLDKFGDNRFIDFASSSIMYMGSSAMIYYINGAVITSSAMVLNNWYHVALVRSSGTSKMYLNGTQTGVNYTDATNYTGASIIVGTDRGSFGQFLKGYISDLRITKGTAVYKANFVPPVAPLTAIQNTTLLLSGDKSAIADKSGKVVLETIDHIKLSTAVRKYGSSSMYFDGTGDCLSIPNNPVFNFGTGDFTVEAWIYLPTVTNVGIIGFGSGGFFVQINTSTNIHVSQANVVDLGDFTISPAILANTWYHLAMTRSGTSMRAFINGIQQGSTLTNSTNFTATNATIVGGHPGPIILYSGYMDDLRVTRGYARYTANFTPPSSALLTK